MTIYDTLDLDARREGVDAAATAARAGRLVVLPTDTVYGIGADAFNASAVRDLLAAKGRGPDMPVPVLVGSWGTINGLVLALPKHARTLIEAFWPGGLSIIVEHAPSLAWNLGDTRSTVMVRMPLHPVALELLRAVGPMAVSSANITGLPPATTADQARSQLAEQVAVYLDAGPSPVGIASTVIDLTGEVPLIRREGAVPFERVQAVVPEVRRPGEDDAPIVAPETPPAADAAEQSEPADPADPADPTAPTDPAERPDAG